MAGVLRCEGSSDSDGEWEYLEAHPTTTAASEGAAEVETHGPTSGGGVRTETDADAGLHEVTAVYEERLRVLQATNEGLEATIRDMEAAQQLRELEVAGLRTTIEAMTRETQQREEEARLMRATIDNAEGKIRQEAVYEDH
ncbi:Biotin carboxylase C-terminal domain containing protein [Novymonas esmeraldas]|uniref:Biotin carboxylase C-terminal domain containing protein n=1 Tax=Novymonas esmeraldas TaxID=1808958 RepID=A0AAW0EZW6_9TRYP